MIVTIDWKDIVCIALFVVAILILFVGGIIEEIADNIRESRKNRQYKEYEKKFGEEGAEE